MLLIVWASMTGATRQLAEAAADGARAAIETLGADGGSVMPEIRCLPAAEAGSADILHASGYLFATPEYLGGIAGAMKDLFDRTYYPALGNLNGRPWAAIVCAGNDGQGATAQLERIATGWRLRRVAPPLRICTHAQTVEAILAPKRLTLSDREAASALGASLAAGLALRVF